MTRVAVAGLPPLLVGAGRAAVAGLLAVVALVATRQPPPRGTRWTRLIVVAAGVVVGFPFLTAYALRTVPASHAAVVVGALPAATAALAVLRARERPARRFWWYAAAGAGAATAVGALHGGALGPPRGADLLLVGAVLACAAGYAEGGLLARELGAWQTIAWALVVAWPVMLTLTALEVARTPPHATATQWAAGAYLAVVSMFAAFVAWYRGSGSDRSRRSARSSSSSRRSGSPGPHCSCASTSGPPRSSAPPRSSRARPSRSAPGHERPSRPVRETCRP